MSYPSHDPRVTDPVAPQRRSSLHLALEIDGAGAHPAAWRRPGAPDGGDVQALRRIAAAAESAGFTFVTLDDALLPAPGDAPVRLDAVTRAAYLAPLTSTLGLAPLAHPAVTEPFHLASQLASLDHASRGRAGWVVGSAAVPGADRALDRPVADGAALPGETADVITVARDLWDSWEDDAVIRDIGTGRYIDRDRLHYVDFVSSAEAERARFTVKGPLIVPRGPQGHPVVIARAGRGADGLADVLLISSLDEVAAARAGADQVFLDLVVALDGAGSTGRQRVSELNALTGSGTDAWFTGSAAALVELVGSLRGVVDGVRLLPAETAVDVPLLLRDVLPALRVSRTIAHPTVGATLRQTLGLPRPQNRFAAAAAR